MIKVCGGIPLADLENRVNEFLERNPDYELKQIIGPIPVSGNQQIHPAGRGSIVIVAVPVFIKKEV